MQSKHLKIMIFTGASGCGKTALIEVYCKQNSLPLTTFRTSTLSRMFTFEDAVGLKHKYYDGDLSYPDDLEELIYFLNVKQKQVESRSGQNGSAGQVLKRSGFAKRTK